MTAKKHVNVTFNLPDPDGPPKNVHAEVGGKATWKSNAHHYPKFEVEFVGPNPSTAEDNAKFGGSSGKPVVLPLKTPGQFNYKIKHIKANGGPPASIGPFSLGVAPEGQAVDNICKGCPPHGTSA